MQIIINRIALLAVSQTTVRRIKWGTFAILAVINISVFCIWIPARLQINKTYIHINDIWDRVEKGIFAVIDLALNLYFVYLVRSSLISYGLTKYVALYRFNLVMVVISISMDVGLAIHQTSRCLTNSCRSSSLRACRLTIPSCAYRAQ